MKNDKLRNARKARGFTQQRLAKKVGVATITVRKWEDGTRPISIECRDLLCATLEITATQLGLDNTPLSAVQGDQNRLSMLKRVHTRWIGVLDHLLSQGTPIQVHLREQPDTVVNPWAEAVQESNLPERLLPEGTDILAVYDHADGAFLLLGEPGAGKTTQLLELARDLLERARLDNTHPLPVVFNLSSWVEKRVSISSWMIEELHSKYQVPRRLAEKWVGADHILPLLDGLDEVVETERVACGQAINAYRQDHGFVPMVVCCRTNEYIALSTHLALHTAIAIEPLTTQQIDLYLQNNTSLSTLTRAFKNDPLLIELASTPLMLSLLTIIYSKETIKDITSTHDIQQQRTIIFTKYIEVLLGRRTVSKRYFPPQTKHWLSWLARHMRQTNQTEFYIERLQPTLLEGETRQRYYRTMTLLTGGFLGIVACSLFAWMRGKDTIGTDIGGLLGWLGAKPGERILGWMSPGLGGGIAGGGTLGLLLLLTLTLIADMTRISSYKIAWTRNALWQNLRHKLLNGLKVGVIIGAFCTILFAVQGVDLSHGVAFGVLGGLLSGLMTTPTTNLPLNSNVHEIASISNRKRTSLLIDSLIIAISGGLAFGLTDYAITHNLYDTIEYGSIVGLFTGLVPLTNFKAYANLGYGLGREIHPTEKIVWFWKKQHLIQDITTSLLFGFPLASSTALFLGITSALFYGRAYGLVFGTVNGVIVGVVVTTTGIMISVLNRCWEGDTLELEKHAKPNEGIWRSLQNSLIIASVFGISGALFSGVMSGLAFGLIGHLKDWLLLGEGFTIVFGIVFVYLFGIIYGGVACIAHGILRIYLWREGAIPWNYSRFLEYAVERGLLRKVGGGYMFAHYLLLDHFAHEKSKIPKMGRF